MQTASNIHMQMPARASGPPSPYYGGSPARMAPYHVQRQAPPPPQAVISHVPLTRQQPTHIQSNPQNRNNVILNNRPPGIQGLIQGNPSINMYPNPQQIPIQPNHPQFINQNHQIQQRPQIYPNMNNHPHFIGQQPFQMQAMMPPYQCYPYPAYIHPINEQQVEQFEYYDPDIIEQSVYCVLCEQTYDTKDRQAHLLKHQRRPRSPLRINKIEEYKFDNQPMMRPIVEPQQFNIQYKPNSYTLDNATNFNTQERGEKVSKSIGTQEGVSNSSVIPSMKNRFSTIHEEEDEQMSPKRPSTHYNHLTQTQNYENDVETNRNSRNNDGMIIPPSMDRKLDSSGDKFYSSNNPSTDRERFNRSSYDRGDDYQRQHSVVNVRDSFKSSDQFEYKKQGLSMYKANDRISEREQQHLGASSPMGRSKSPHQSYDNMQRSENYSRPVSKQQQKQDQIPFDKILQGQGVYNKNNESFQNSQSSKKKRISKQAYGNNWSDI